MVQVPEVYYAAEKNTPYLYMRGVQAENKDTKR